MYKIGDRTSFLLARIQCSLISFRLFSCSCLRCNRGCTHKHTHTHTHTHINTMSTGATHSNIMNYHNSQRLSSVNLSKVYLDEGLVVQGGVGLLQPHTLLLVLLQSQRVDGEEGHVGLERGDTNTEREGLISNRRTKCHIALCLSKFLTINITENQWEIFKSEINEVYMCYAVFAGLV